jgi:hypothetical protein
MGQLRLRFNKWWMRYYVNSRRLLGDLVFASEIGGEGEASGSGGVFDSRPFIVGKFDHDHVPLRVVRGRASHALFNFPLGHYGLYGIIAAV